MAQEDNQGSPFRRYRAVRRLRSTRGGTAGPLLVADLEAGEALRVLRVVDDRSVAAFTAVLGLRHPHLATLLGRERSPDGSNYLVLEYVPGNDLSELLPSLDREQRLAILCDVLAGLEALHRHGLAHGDLKPGNIIVRPNGRAVLIDPAFVDSHSAALGTLQYLAPERLLSAPPTPAADLFAFGCVAYEAVTGSPLREQPDSVELVRAALAGVDARAIERQIEDPRIRDVVLRCLESDPSLRLGSARLALDRLTTDSPHGDRRDLSAEFAVAPAILPRASEDRLERLLASVRRGTSSVLVIDGPPGSGKSTHLQRARTIARRHGYLAVDLGTVTDWDRALTELESTGSPVLFVGDDLEPSEALRSALGRALDAIASERIAATLLLSGSAEDALLAIPRGVAVVCEEWVAPPLRATEIAAFIRSVVPELSEAEALSDAVEEWTRGSAAAVRHCLVRFAAAQGFSVRGAIVAADPSRLAAVPPVPSEPIATPTDPLERELFSLLALLDVSVEIDVLARAADAPGIAILEKLAGAARRGFIRDFAPPLSSGTLSLSSFATQRAAGGAFSNPADRKAALALARALANRVEHASGVARLFEAAGRRVAARAALRAASRSLGDGRAQDALDSLALAKRVGLPRGRVLQSLELEASAHALQNSYSRADEAYRALAERAPLLPARIVVQHAQMLERASRAPEALERLESALARARGGDVVALRAARAWALEACGQRDRARSEIEALWSLRGGFAELDPRLEVAAVAAALFDRSGQRRLSRAATLEARRLARRLGRPTRAAHFDSTLAMFDAETGKLDRASRRLERAAAALEAAKDRRLLPDTLTRIGMLELERGAAQRALGDFQRAAILFARAENRRGLGWALAGEGAARLRVGDPEGAVRCLETSIEHRLAVHAPAGAALAGCELIRARAALGDVPGVRATLKRVLGMARPLPVSAQGALLLVLGELARDRGARAILRGCSKRLLASRFDALPLAERARAELLVAEYDLERGDARAALRRARVARSTLRSGASRAGLALATGVRAAACLALDKLRAARIAFEAAVEYSAEHSTRVAVCLSFARAVKRAIARGQVFAVDVGQAAAREALRIASQIGDRQRSSLAREAMSVFATAVASRQVEGDLLRENRLLRQVIEATRWINEADSLPEILGRIIDAALELTGASRGFVVTSMKSVLRFEAARNLRQQDIEEPGMQLSRSIIERTISRAETIVTSEARTDERFREFASISQLALLSVMCAPLKTRRGVLGAIYVDDPERIDRFDDSARRVIEALAEHAAIALEKAELREQIVALNADLERDVHQRTREIETVRDDLEKARRDLDRKRGIRAIVTQDPKMLELLAVIERAADSDAPALILGEAGTGKELIARALHESSYRRRHRFVALNCASLPETLIEAELFGYRKGAFTGATKDRDGLITAADRGTLFLDEIAELPLAAQAKLLRVLQNGEYLPIGGNEPRRAQFRVVAATNRPLKQWVDSGRFREDLFWRLRVLQLDVPPLRERASDIPLLVHHFATRGAAETGGTPMQFEDAALHALGRARFPGNIRELEALIRALRVTVRGPVVTWNDLPAEYRSSGPQNKERDAIAPPTVPRETDGTLMDWLDLLERQYVVEALERANGDRNAAAQALGISLRWLQKLVKKHAIAAK